MTLTILQLFLAAAHLADAFSTRWAIKRGSVEANPALAWLDKTITPLPNTGKWLWLVVPKAVLIALQWWALWEYYPADWVIILTCMTIVLHAGIASHNLMTVRKK